MDKIKMSKKRIAKRRSTDEVNQTYRRRDGYVPFTKQEGQAQWSLRTQQRVHEAMVVYGD